MLPSCQHRPSTRQEIPGALQGENSPIGRAIEKKIRCEQQDEKVRNKQTADLVRNELDEDRIAPRRQEFRHLFEELKIAGKGPHFSRELGCRRVRKAVIRPGGPIEDNSSALEYGVHRNRDVVENRI